MTIATLAGVVSTVLFTTSMLPMLIRAARTRDVSSYSRSHLVLTTLGNLVHTVYVFHLPPGPIWALHVFYLVSTLQMLRWHLRHPAAVLRSEPDRSIGPAGVTVRAHGC